MEKLDSNSYGIISLTIHKCEFMIGNVGSSAYETIMISDTVFWFNLRTNGMENSTFRSLKKTFLS